MFPLSTPYDNPISGATRGNIPSCWFYGREAATSQGLGIGSLGFKVQGLGLGFRVRV